MTRGASCYGACEALFATYPLAVEDDGESSGQSMTLMLPGAPRPAFFVLTRQPGRDGGSYRLRPWGGGSGAAISPDAGPAPAVTRGLPLPADGSLFGWISGGAVTTLAAVRAAPETPFPTWSSMPRAGLPAGQWPPFTTLPVFGEWFWEHVRHGRLVSLAALIAATPRTVFWVTDPAPPGWGSCVVTSDAASPDGFTLPAGRYSYYKALHDTPAHVMPFRAGDAVDLASRFGA